MFRDFVQIGLQKSTFISKGFVVDKPKDTDINNAINTNPLNTGFGRNDIGVYMSDETDPRIADYIHKKRLGELPTGEDISAVHQDDDAIIQGMPNRGETLNQYEERVDAMLKHEKDERKRKLNEKKLKDAFKKVGLSTD